MKKGFGKEIKKRNYLEVNRVGFTRDKIEIKIRVGSKREK